MAKNREDWRGREGAASGHGKFRAGCIVMEQEDQAVKSKIAKCSARWSMAANRDDKEGLLRWSREWAGISEKLLRFWVQLGCPKLPPNYEERIGTE